ncbi:MAG: NnrS family protein [Rhodanobacter sp.]|nr:MAG: NnrS family protein [Rhodanobacter sp.]TAM10501.1 MAG: NnrS family protein [Rhodanobacter sp.]TAM36644.1 MAG: NnrS family protein [Rhodanobacter sp.]
MDASTSSATFADGPAALLAAAPHRPLFLAGTIAVLLSMTWWTLELASLRFGWFTWPQPTIPPVWGHAMLIQYGLFPLFMFGFLMTTFPRWMNGPTVPARRYLPVAGGVLGGYIVGTIGLLDMPTVLKIGVAMMLAGYLIGVSTLAGVLRASADRNKHGWSTLAAFCVGTLGLALFFAWLLFPDSVSPDAAWVAVRMGTFTFLLPIYFTVTHRMLPFFSRNLVPGYAMWRPNWSLPVAWALLIAHVVLVSAGLAGWLWLCDVPLALVFGAHWLMWKPWRCMHPGLLAVLHIAFAWLPIGFVLFSAQDLVYATSGAHILGLAPLHAIAIGFFGSMLVAMVTRVTHGHSGRPLQMHPIPWLCFGLLQVVALIRIGAELGGDHYLWLVVAGAGWLVAFLPWVLRSAWIYLTPRADGRPG